MTSHTQRATFWWAWPRIRRGGRHIIRSEEHTSELQSPDTISYAVFCLKKKNSQRPAHTTQVARFPSTETLLVFFFHYTATTEIYTVSDTLSLHDALPISVVAIS